MIQCLCVIFFSFFLVSCQTTKRGMIVSPLTATVTVEWTDEEKHKEIAVRKLRETPHASYHIIRLNASEKPHIHLNHDLAVFVLAGEAIVHLENKAIKIKPGDVVEIPRGIVHWGEILNNNPCEVYAIFTPAFDGVDHQLVE